CGPARRVALHDEELGELRVPNLAVGELLGYLATEGSLTPGEIPCLAGGLAGARGSNRLLNDLLRIRRVLLEELGQFGVHGLLDEASHPGVPQLRLGLPFELRLLKLHGDDCGETLSSVLALEVLVLLLQQPQLACEAVQRPRQRRIEAGQV